MATDTSMLVNLGLGLLPVLWLLVAMVATPLPAYVSSLGALALSLVLARAWWGLGAPEATGAILEGTAFALWNVCLVIVAALFAYDLLAHTGSLDVIGKALSTQCVAIGTGATGLSGNESQVFRRVLIPAVACLVVASALCLWLAT